MTHLVPAKLLFLTDGKLCSQGRAELSGELEIKNYCDSFIACERAVKCGMILTSSGLIASLGSGVRCSRRGNGRWECQV